MNIEGPDGFVLGDIGPSPVSPANKLHVVSPGSVVAHGLLAICSEAGAVPMKVRNNFGVDMFAAALPNRFMPGTTQGDVGLRSSIGDDFFLGQGTAPYITQY